jgi:hypothetical protein
MHIHEVPATWNGACLSLWRTHKEGVMNQRTYRRVFQQFLNEYWGAFHEVLEAQSVNPKLLAGSLFDDLAEAHRRFAAAAPGIGSDLDRLGRLWEMVATKRQGTPDAPLSAREIDCARAIFESIYDGFVARGELYSLASAEVHAAALHGTPRTRLRPDAVA